MKILDKFAPTFLRYVAFRYIKPIQFIKHDFEFTCKFFNIPTIHSSLIQNNLLFAYKVISNQVDCSKLLNSFDFYISPFYLVEISIIFM